MFYEKQSLISDAFRFQEWSLGTGDQSKEERGDVGDGFLGYSAEVERMMSFSKSSHCEYRRSLDVAGKSSDKIDADILFLLVSGSLM